MLKIVILSHISKFPKQPIDFQLSKNKQSQNILEFKTIVDDIFIFYMFAYLHSFEKKERIFRNLYNSNAGI